jgi:hypothetical protein
MTPNKQIKIISPISVILPRKTKPNRKIMLNLNNYRNWCFPIAFQAKQAYTEALKLSLRGLKLKKGIDLRFVLYKPSNRKSDRSNVLSIVEKFFCDSLVHYKCIPDDSDEFIKSTHYETGGVDKSYPRVEIIIT